MSEFKRWTDEGAPDAIGRLLVAAGSEQPSAASLANTLTRLGVVAGVTTGAATSGAAGATALTGGAALAGGAAGGKLSALALTATLAKWIALGTAVGGASLAVYTATSDSPAPASAPSAAAQPAGLASAAAPARPAPPVPPPRTAPSSEAPRRIADPAGPRTSATAATSRGRSATDAARDPQAEAEAIPAETLAAEIAGIDRARSILAAGRPAAAVAALDDFERRFPRHHFAPEVLYLRMEAAARAGRTQAARQLALSLLARYPTSPQSEKAKYLLDQKSSDRR